MPDLNITRASKKRGHLKQRAPVHTNLILNVNNAKRDKFDLVIKGE